MNLQNKNKADKTLHALGFNTSQRERIISLAKDNIANNASNVNNTDTKFLVMLILIVDTIFLMR